MTIKKNPDLKTKETYTDDLQVTEKGPFKYNISENGPHGSNVKPASMVERKRHFPHTISNESSPAKKQKRNFDALLKFWGRGDGWKVPSTNDELARQQISTQPQLVNQIKNSDLDQEILTTNGCK